MIGILLYALMFLKFELNMNYLCTYNFFFKYILSQLYAITVRINIQQGSNSLNKTNFNDFLNRRLCGLDFVSGYYLEN